MKKWKCIVSLVLAVAMLLGLCACSRLTDEYKAERADEKSADSGYDTAEEAFLAYCEGLFTFDWEMIESTIHPDMMESDYGREFMAYYYATPEYADRMIIMANDFDLRSEEFEDRAAEIDLFEEILEEQCSVELSVKALKYNKVSFDTDYDGWTSFVFAEDQFVFKCDGKWYAFPWFKELTVDTEQEQTVENDSQSETGSVSTEDTYVETEPSEDVGFYFGAEGEAVEESAWQMLSHLEKNEGAKAAELLKEIYRSAQGLVMGTETGCGYPISEDCSIWNDPELNTFLSIGEYELDLYVEEPGLRVRFWKLVPEEPGSITYEQVCTYILDFTEEWEFLGWSYNDAEKQVWYEYDANETLTDEWSYS